MTPHQNDENEIWHRTARQMGPKEKGNSLIFICVQITGQLVEPICLLDLNRNFDRQNGEKKLSNNFKIKRF